MLNNRTWCCTGVRLRHDRSRFCRPFFAGSGYRRNNKDYFGSAALRDAHGY